MSVNEAPVLVRGGLPSIEGHLGSFIRVFRSLEENETAYLQHENSHKGNYEEYDTATTFHTIYVFRLQM